MYHRAHETDDRAVVSFLWVDKRTEPRLVVSCCFTDEPGRRDEMRERRERAIIRQI